MSETPVFVPGPPDPLDDDTALGLRLARAQIKAGPPPEMRVAGVTRGEHEAYVIDLLTGSDLPAHHTVARHLIAERDARRR